MSPEKITQLSTPEFSALLTADPVLTDLRVRLVSSRDFIPGTFDALLMSGGDRIGNLSVLPLTAAKWAFLWLIESPFVTWKNPVSDTDLNIFLFILNYPDLRKLQIPLSRLPAEAGHHAQTVGMEPAEILNEIRQVINSAFAPLSMLPRTDSDPEENFYDGVWLAWIASIVVRESGLPYDRVIHELPLSLVCNFYVAWRRREGIDGDKIRRPQNGEIMDRINARVEELGKQFLQTARIPGDHMPAAAPSVHAPAEDLSGCPTPLRPRRSAQDL